MAVGVYVQVLAGFLARERGTSRFIRAIFSPVLYDARSMQRTSRPSRGVSSLLVVSALLVACNGASPGGGSDAGARSDAGGNSAVDAGQPPPTDSGGMWSGTVTYEACMSYCQTFQTNCATVDVAVPEGQACMAYCQSFTQQALDCRMVHCTLSSAESSWHCEHCLGIGQCVCTTADNCE
jgi:hypothetical protein